MKRMLSSIVAALVLAAVPSLAQNTVPTLTFDAASALTLPDDVYLGEVGGVATTSRGDIYVYTRTGQSDAVARHRAAVLARRLAVVSVRSQRTLHARDRRRRVRVPVCGAGAR
jgi:hypothetical protein